MLTTALRSAWARKRRLVGTTVAVVLGVSFLAATLVVGASARSGFRQSFGTANAEVDAVVRSSDRLTGGVEDARPPVPASLVEATAGVAGVADARPLVEGTALVVAPDGHPVSGADALAQNWVDDPGLTGWRLASGRAPATAGEVVIDRASVDDAGLTVGDETTVLVPAAVPVTVVGIATFGDDDTRAGATFVAFSTAEAQRLLLGSSEVVSAVLVAGAPEIDQASLADRVGEVLPGGAEAVTGRAYVAEQQDEVEGDLVGALTTGLLVFAVVALVVAAVGITNTFSILAAQRVRESALLRALGASRRQVLGAALVEAVMVGLVGSLLGVVAGLALASGLVAAMASIGFDLPVDGLVLRGGDVAVAVLVGLVVTVVGAVPAAWRASRVAPVTALREADLEDADTAAHGRSRRAIAGAVGVVSGTASVILGGGGALGLVALGAILLVVGLVLVGPVAVRPVCAALGAPLGRLGLAGELAARNAVRNPRRSAATASALLIGVGVVSLFAVFGASAARSVDEGVSRAFVGDVAVTPAGAAEALAPATLETVAALPEVAGVAGVGSGAAVLDGQQDDLTFADLDALPTVLDLEVTAGHVTDGDGAGGPAGDGRLLASVDEAEERGWEVGDRVAVGFPDGRTVELTLVAIYTSEAIVGDVVVPASRWEEHTGQAGFAVVVVDLADGVDTASGRAAVAAATTGPGAPEVQDRAGFVADEVGQVSGVIDLSYGFLAVAILIALVGIANTVSLSVHERTRELGLLRAVGQGRPQLRAMVRWESVVVAAFGALGGVGLGTFLGWGVVRAIAARADIATFTLPVVPLLLSLLTGVLVGALAAARPAWRASRLPVLDALAAR